MILVIGSTGTTGRFVLERLSAAGLPARALVRPASARPALQRLPGVEVVLGDAGDPPSLRAALRGVDRVFVAMGNGPDQLDRELAVVREAVHVAPTIRLAGFFSGITGDTPMNVIDARDIADVAVVALSTDGARGPLVLTGSETVSYPEVARRLTALGRPTRYVDLDPEDYRRSLRRAGLQPWLVEHLAEIQALALTHPEFPNGTVAALTGRPPRTLDAFLRENRARFAAPLSWRERLAALPLRVVAGRASAGKVFEHEVA